MTKTWTAKPHEIKRQWWLVDASECPLGRLASQVSVILRGKHKAEFTPHVDMGDFVVVINAERIQLTGKKLDNKKYYSHSGYFGSLKVKKIKDMENVDIVHDAISGMLPKNKMRKRLMRKLKVYKEGSHPHQSQKPIKFSLKKSIKDNLS